MKMTMSAATALAVLVAGCGGGSGGETPGGHAAALHALAETAQGPTSDQDGRRRALEVSSAFSADVAERVFNLAETSYAQHFPSRQPTRGFEGWAYRHYPQTDVYLAVIGSGVFVLGGVFGPDAIRAGSVTDFVQEPATGKARPLTAAILGKCPDALASNSPDFYRCMVGHLRGVQAFDDSKACRLDVEESGTLTLSTAERSGSVGPGFGFVNFLKNGAFGNLMILVSGVGPGAPRLVVNASPTLSFTDGGVLEADFTPPGSGTASISCRLDVPR